MEALQWRRKPSFTKAKHYTIKIPAGVDEGNRMRFGLFDVSFAITPSKVFKREGADVIVNFVTSLTTAILGGDVDVPTLSRPTVRVKPGTSTGNRYSSFLGQRVSSIQLHSPRRSLYPLHHQNPHQTLSSHQKSS